MRKTRGKTTIKGDRIGWKSARRQIETRFPPVFLDRNTAKFYIDQINPVPHCCEICWKLHPNFVEAVLCEEECAKKFGFKFKRYQVIILNGYELQILNLCRKHPRCGDKNNYYECSPLDVKKSEDGGECIMTVSEDLLSFGRILS